MVTEFPVMHSIDVQLPGEEIKDRFNNVRTAPAQWQQVGVIGWAVVESQESVGDSVLRTVDVLELYAPAEVVLDAATRVRTPDGQVWAVDGNAKDYTHGPFWDPGALVYRCRKVDG